MVGELARRRFHLNAEHAPAAYHSKDVRAARKTETNKTPRLTLANHIGPAVKSMGEDDARIEIQRLEHARKNRSLSRFRPRQFHLLRRRLAMLALGVEPEQFGLVHSRALSKSA